MLELGADVHASSTFRGLTALHVAISGNLEMVRVLMYFGRTVSTSISGRRGHNRVEKQVRSVTMGSMARAMERCCRRSCKTFESFKVDLGSDEYSECNWRGSEAKRSHECLERVRKKSSR